MMNKLATDECISLARNKDETSIGSSSACYDEEIFLL
jgi:hypothetical protein